MYFNVFEAAPENERDGPTQQAQQNIGGKVRYICSDCDYLLWSYKLTPPALATRILSVVCQ